MVSHTIMSERIIYSDFMEDIEQHLQFLSEETLSLVIEPIDFLPCEISNYLHRGCEGTETMKIQRDVYTSRLYSKGGHKYEKPTTNVNRSSSNIRRRAK